MSFPRAPLLVLVTLLVPAVAVAQPAATPPTAPAAAAVRAPRAFVNVGARFWDAGSDSEGVPLGGIQMGVHVGPHAALTADLSMLMADVSEEGGVFALRFGGRAFVLPGTVRPYLSARAGVLAIAEESVGIWDLGGGVQIVEPSTGLLLDAGLGMVGAVGESEMIAEYSLSVGKQF